MRSTLKGIESALGQHPQFFRCHRAFVVNLSTVVHADGNARGYQLPLEGGEGDDTGFAQPPERVRCPPEGTQPLSYSSLIVPNSPQTACLSRSLCRVSHPLALAENTSHVCPNQWSRKTRLTDN
ncbi:LytTR family DNA-binding domain-containing protein [Spirosoma agri]|uniref:LytTR family DNA-binding domain-containing protein n=1 Tax=Spirosoma agri TaxID=1987381 RepID=UPI00293BE9C7|nr:LytTR family DNA-binding domain-containing protein [Spirosoma agri]